MDNKQANNKSPKQIKEQSEEELKSTLDFNTTITDKASLIINNAFGSIQFLAIIVISFVIWILWNLDLLPYLKPFDKYPFVLLTMIVSLFAVVLSIFVLISQNRERKIEKIRAQVEFEVNVRAEHEITKVLEMLHEIQKKMGLDSDSDLELEQMKQTLNIKELHEKMNEEEF